MPSLRGTQNGRHFPLSFSYTLSLHLPSISCSRRVSLVQTTVNVPLSLHIPPLPCPISTYPYLHNFLPLPLTLINSNNTPFPATQPITPPSPFYPPPYLHLSLSRSPSFLSPFIEPNLFVMSSLGKLHPICCHSLNEFICLCIGHGSISPSSLSLSYPPTPLLVFPWGLYIYRGQLQAPIVPPSKLTDRCPAPQCGSEPKESGGGRQLVIVESKQTIGSWKRCRLDSSPAPLHPLRRFCVSSACVLVVTVDWRSDVLTPCSCSYHCCLWDLTACWEPRQVERSTGCLRVLSKVAFSLFLMLRVVTGVAVSDYYMFFRGRGDKTEEMYSISVLMDKSFLCLFLHMFLLTDHLSNNCNVVKTRRFYVIQPTLMSGTCSILLQSTLVRDLWPSVDAVLSRAEPSYKRLVIAVCV